MSKSGFETLVWRKSRYCETSACVEIARCDDGTIFLRDGKDPDGPVLRFTERQWLVFLSCLRSGEFNVGRPNAG